jgi:hypothetical protein
MRNRSSDRGRAAGGTIYACQAHAKGPGAHVEGPGPIG